MCSKRWLERCIIQTCISGCELGDKPDLTETISFKHEGWNITYFSSISLRCLLHRLLSSPPTILMPGLGLFSPFLQHIQSASDCSQSWIAVTTIPQNEPNRYINQGHQFGGHSNQPRDAHHLVLRRTFFDARATQNADNRQAFAQESAASPILAAWSQ